MFDTDDKIISFALSTWANYIETFSVSMSAEDAKAKNQEDVLEPVSNYLTTPQKALVKRIRELATEYGEKQ